MSKDLAVELEHYVTPEWAVDAILKTEGIVGSFIDPCTGTGILHRRAVHAGYHGHAYDIHDWGYPDMTDTVDFLSLRAVANINRQSTFLMNPPFSKACEFVAKAFELGAHKVICFQRFSWWESEGRRAFWELYPPSKVYVCGNRATCWRHDVLADPETAKSNGTTTAHAWFIFDRHAPPGTLLGHVWKDAA